MKKLFAILLTLALLLSLSACGKETAEDPNAGKYLGSTASAFGLTVDITEVFPGQTWLELKSGGKGTLMLDDESLAVKWSLDGESLTLKVDGFQNVGTLKDGIITIELMDMGMETTFVKRGLELSAPTEASAPKATYHDAAFWDIVRVESDDPNSVISEEEMAFAKDYGTVIYLELKEDGTGILFLEEEMPITWQDGSFTNEENLTWNYRLENDELYLTIDTTTLVFRQGEKILVPEYEPAEMEEAGFMEFMEFGEPYAYTTICSKDETKSTTAEATVTSYDVFDSAEGYDPMEGYEWRVVTMELLFDDENAREYGRQFASNTVDYYNVKLHDDTNELLEETDDYELCRYSILWNGQQMDAYVYISSFWDDGPAGDGDRIAYLQWDFQVPVGYDGCVVGLRDAAIEWTDGTYFTDMDPADFLLFRLN